MGMTSTGSPALLSSAPYITGVLSRRSESCKAYEAYKSKCNPEVNTHICSSSTTTKRPDPENDVGREDPQPTPSNSRQSPTVIEERDPNIHLGVHNRHFMPGEYVHDNIIWAVQNSKRTVLILSKNFLDSEWCLMEFRTAHTQALEDKVHRIIVIKVGDLPKEMDPEIKDFLDTTTYLTWGEKDFLEQASVRCTNWKQG